MGRKKLEVASEVRVVDNPNFKRYKETDIYVSKLGEIYKVTPEKDIKKSVVRRKETGMCRVWVGKRYLSFPKIVWETFKGDIPNGYVIDHKNKMKLDNRLTNLECISEKELHKRYCGKTSQMRYVYNCKTGETYKGVMEACKKVGYSKRQVIKICNGQTTNPFIQLKYLDERPYERI